MSEHDLQCAVASLLNSLELEGKLFWHHPPNEGKRHNGRRLVSAGMKAGVPDCCIVLRGGQAVFIELKTKKGSLSANQKAAHEAIRDIGAPLFTIKADNTFDAVREVRALLHDLGVVT